MPRIWHPYYLWEDYKQGMWRKLPRHEEQEALQTAIEFTGNTALYGEWMRRATQEYYYACQHNLTDPSLNKQAWIGHAACCLAKKLPEYIVRKAWAVLSEQQRVEANKQADAAVIAWTVKHLEETRDDRQLCLDFFTQAHTLYQCVET